MAAGSSRAWPGDEDVVTPAPMVAPVRERSSWRHIPLATASLATFLIAVLVITPETPLTHHQSGAASAVTASEAETPVATILAAIAEAAQANEPAEPERTPVWAPIERPFAFVNLEAPTLDRLPRTHAAARHTTGGGRDDVLIFGDFADDTLHVRLSAYRPGAEAPAPSTFFVDLVRRASEAGVAVTKSAVATPLATKLGLMETADAVLSDNNAERPCLAFRFLSYEPRLRLSGWACGTAERPADRVLFTCLIDRLDLVAAGEDKALAAFFAKAERARNAACGAPHLLTAGAKSRWLDGPAAMPPLKDGRKPR